MKARTAFIALALFSAQASAEWELISESVSGTKYFMDLSTKRQQGKYTLAWEMAEYAKAGIVEGKIYNSDKALVVYDCAEFRYGIKSLVSYSGKSGTGDVVRSESLEMYSVKFDDIVPETTGETKFNKACGISK